MRYEIVLGPEAVVDLKSFAAAERSAIRDALERFLRYAPTKLSRSRMKRLRGLSKPQFRLRVRDDIRVFYDVTEQRVEVLGIVSKENVERWLRTHGKPP